MSRLSFASPSYASARVEQLARHDEAVATVIALAGEHDGFLRLVALEDLAGHGHPGALHQVAARDPQALDRDLVDLPHDVRRVQAEQQGLIHALPP
jgi:hypothetical protein